MKNLKNLLFLMFTSLTFAQNPVIDLKNYYGDDIAGAYYKDVGNLLNAFEGTYVYTNGNEIFKIVLVKKVMQYDTEYYEDLIIGEYQHIKNGLERINTISQINTIYNNQRRHNIKGNSLINKNNRQWKCPECNDNEKRLRLSIKDVSTGRIADILIRRTIENGQQIIKINITNIMGVGYIATEGLPPEFSLPIGEFTMIKQ